MRVRNATLFVLISALAAWLLTGCAALSRKFVCEPPAYRTVPLSGIPGKAKPFELVDRYGEYTPTADTLVLIVKEKKQTKALKVCCTTGQTVPVATVSEQRASYYWDEYKQAGLGLGKMLVGALMSTTFLGGTTDKFSFVAQKRMNGPDSVLVTACYQYTKREFNTSASDQGLATAEESDESILYVERDGNENRLHSYRGCPLLFNRQGNVHRCRFYAISDSTLIGSMPERKGGRPGHVIMMVGDIPEERCWGADMPLTKGHRYMDFGITPDRQHAAYLLSVKSGYVIATMPPGELARSILHAASLSMP